MSSNTIYGRVSRPGSGHKLEKHTVAEFIEILKSFPLDARILLRNANDRSSYCPLTAITGECLSPLEPSSTSDSPFRVMKNGQINTVVINAIVGGTRVDNDTPPTQSEETSEDKKP